MADTDELFRRLAASGPAGGRRLLGPRPERARPRTRPRLRRRLLLHGRLGQRDAQPEEHRDEHRRRRRPHRRHGPCRRRRPARASRCRSSPPSGAASKARCRAERVLGLARRFLDAGLTTVSLADTAGHANPAQVEDAVRRRQRRSDDRLTTACHFHDTYGLGLANVYAALRAGVTSFESRVRRPRRLPVHGRRRGQRVHRGPRAPVATAWACGRRRRRRSRWPRSTTDAAAFFGRALPGTIHRTGPIPHSGAPPLTRAEVRTDETARRRAGARPDQRAGRPVRHHAPGPGGRRRHQDREPRRAAISRASSATCRRSTRN